jgi:hypothetical protein
MAKECICKHYVEDVHNILYALAHDVERLGKEGNLTPLVHAHIMEQLAEASLILDVVA